MRFYRYLAAIAILIVALPSCQTPNPYSAELAELDSLKTEMMALELSLEDFDVEKLAMIDSSVRVISAQLDLGIQDTLNRQEWMLLGNYTKTISKRLNKFDKKLEKLNREVAISLSQITDLNADLERNALKMEKAKSYLLSEKQKAAALSAATAQLKENATKAMETYYEEHESVDSLMEQISQRMRETVEQ